MAEIAANIDAFAEIDEAEDFGHIRLDAKKKPDRLPPMLFLSALVHGILIVGITFNTVLGDPFAEAISLEVTIVADPKQTLAEPDDADYLAQASQEGQGNTLLEVRPGALPESNMPIDNMGQADGDSFKDSQTELHTADEVLTSERDERLKAAELPREHPTPDATTALAMQSGIEATLPLPEENEANPLIHDDHPDPRRLVTSVDTRESIIAAYLDRWKRKIEATGVRYFPEQAIANGHTGSPTLEVTIDASGRLDDVVVRRSSGSRVLDKAALKILRKAAPFDAFPDAVREKYDQLRFAYKWEFSKIEASSAVYSATSND